MTGKSTSYGFVSRTVIWVLLTLLCISVVLNIALLFRLRGNSVVAVVYDGDSFDLTDGRRVRLLGVDAPEKGRCGYAEAKARLTQMVLGKHVRLKNIITDDYGRLVANVIVEEWSSWIRYLVHVIPAHAGIGIGIYEKQKPAPDLVGGDKQYDPMVNRVMAGEGLAKNLSVKSPYEKQIDQLSSAAKERGLGIYSTRCRSPLPQSECLIKGNIQQEGKFYFIPGCKAYGNVIVDQSFGDAWFCTASDAVAAGFSLAPSCM